MFRQDDGSYNVAWRRPQRKRSLPASGGEGELPPLSAVSGEAVASGSADTGKTDGDGLGDSTAPRWKAKAKVAAKQQETVDA